MFNYCKLYLYSVGWKLVSEKQECGGSEEDGPHDATEVQDCFNKCYGVSSMFVFSSTHKNCYCQTSATAEVTCGVVANHFGANLYEYTNLGRFLIIKLYSTEGEFCWLLINL